jgi:hypothetical protein
VGRNPASTSPVCAANRCGWWAPRGRGCFGCWLVWHGTPALDHGREPGGWRRDKALAIARSQRLDHLVTLNGFYAAFVGHARRNDGCRLVTFLNERRCAQWVGEVVQPDAYGTWHEDGAHIDFFLEVDRGTESLERLTAKFDRYADLERARGETTWVLFAFQSPRRERNARRVLGRTGVPVATTSASGGPVSCIWLPAHRDAPVRIAELAAIPKPRSALDRAQRGGERAWRYPRPCGQGYQVF